MAARSFALLAAPLAWMMALLLAYGLVDRLCAPHARAGRIARDSGALLTLWSVLGIGLALALAGAWSAVRIWRQEHQRTSGCDHQRREPDENGSRFVATINVLTSGGFLVAFLFVALDLLLAPPCGK